MIYESQYWKDALKNDTRTLKVALKKRSRYSESVSVLLERHMFITAFSIRKLLDSDKLSSEVENFQIKVQAYKIKDKSLFQKTFPYLVDDPFDYYNEGNPFWKNLNLRMLCGYFIHSFIFRLVISPDWNKSANQIVFLFNSDKTENFLFKMNLQEWYELCEFVYTDFVISGLRQRQKKTHRVKTVYKERYKS